MRTVAGMASAPDVPEATLLTPARVSSHGSVLATMAPAPMKKLCMA